MDLHSGDKASDLLQNGILVATNKGLICMSLNDALSSNLNLSVDDLKTVAEQLILQEETDKSKSADQHVNLYMGDAHPFSSDATVDSDEPTSDNGINMIKPHLVQPVNKPKDMLNCESAEETSEIHTVCDSDTGSSSTTHPCNMSMGMTSLEVNKLPLKRRGGWPKGRKRKPELLHLPPKAPATGYNLYLNDMRKQFKDSTLAFHEITKIIGNRWSSLSLEEKQPYLERAEEDKRRYREELRVYRQSGAYQLYLAKKRKNRMQNNVLSESDMDATDDIDDEDNEELYCRTCDQWFHNLHNKREHLQGRQHVQAMVGDMQSELGSDYGTGVPLKIGTVVMAESSLEVTSVAPTYALPNSGCAEMSVSESIANLIAVVVKREKEIGTIKIRVEETKAANDALHQQLRSLKEREVMLKEELEKLKNADREMEMQLFKLWKVPSIFITTDFDSSISNGSEYLTDE